MKKFRWKIYCHLWMNWKNLNKTTTANNGLLQWLLPDFPTENPLSATIWFVFVKFSLKSQATATSVGTLAVRLKHDTYETERHL